MNRRRVIKTLGISAALFTTGFIASCSQTGNNKETEELKALKDSLEKEKNKALSEHDKKIINRKEMSIKDTDNPTKAELKHTPEIILGKTDDLSFTEVKITVGTGIIHPSTKEHWIDFIELFADNKLVGRTEYEAGMASGYTVFKINKEGINKLKAVIGCNLHGIWHSEFEI